MYVMPRARPCTGRRSRAGGRAAANAGDGAGATSRPRGPSGGSEGGGGSGRVGGNQIAPWDRAARDSFSPGPAACVQPAYASGKCDRRPDARAGDRISFNVKFAPNPEMPVRVSAAARTEGGGATRCRRLRGLLSRAFLPPAAQGTGSTSGEEARVRPPDEAAPRLAAAQRECRRVTRPACRRVLCPNPWPWPTRRSAGRTPSAEAFEHACDVIYARSHWLSSVGAVGSAGGVVGPFQEPALRRGAHRRHVRRCQQLHDPLDALVLRGHHLVEDARAAICARRAARARRRGTPPPSPRRTSTTDPSPAGRAVVGRARRTGRRAAAARRRPARVGVAAFPARRTRRGRRARPCAPVRGAATAGRPSACASSYSLLPDR